MSDNPKDYINQYYKYSEDSQKLTCRKCRFNMWGCRLEDLEHHLKRKHAECYEELRMRKRSKQVEHPSQLQKSGTQAVDGNQDKASGSHSAAGFTRKLEMKDTKPTDEESDLESEFESGFENKDFDDSVAESPRYYPSATMTRPPSTTWDSIGATPTPQDATMMKPEVNISTKATNGAPPAPPLAAGAMGPARLPDTGYDPSFLIYLRHKMGTYSAVTRSNMELEISKLLCRADQGLLENTHP